MNEALRELCRRPWRALIETAVFAFGLAGLLVFVLLAGVMMGAG